MIRASFLCNKAKCNRTKAKIQKVKYNETKKFIK